MNTALVCVLAALVYAVLAAGARSEGGYKFGRIGATAFLVLAFVSVIVGGVR